MAGLALSLGFLGGILLHDSGIGMVLAFPIVLGAVLVAILLESWPARALVSFVLIFMALGAWRGGQSPSPPPDVIVHLTGHDRAIDATVVGLPRRSTSRTKVTITLAAPPHSMIAASLPAFPDVRDGDVIEFWAPNSLGHGIAEPGSTANLSDRQRLVRASIRGSWLEPVTGGAGSTQSQ